MLDKPKDKKPAPPAKDPMLMIIVFILIISALNHTRLGKYLIGTQATSTSEYATSTGLNTNQ